MKGYPSAPTTTVTVKFNRIPQAKAALNKALQNRVEAAAEALRKALVEAIESGRYDLKSDTGTMIESIYVKTPHGSDYDARLKAALSAYIGNPSRWRDLVQTNIAPDAYTQEHFNERVASEGALPAPSQDEAIAAVATFWAVGFFWEYGHTNQLTGNYEHRPFFGPEADQFGAQEYEKFFLNLLKDFK